MCNDTFVYDRTIISIKLEITAIQIILFISQTSVI